MEFLTKNQKRLLMTGDGKLESNWDGGFISAEGKDVIVIGVSIGVAMIFSRLVDFTVNCCPCTGSMSRVDRVPTNLEYLCFCRDGYCCGQGDIVRGLHGTPPQSTANQHNCF